ncbi:MAG: hypothetical protein ABIA77_06680 [Candidatus Omnitrophota bacterium]
MQDVLEKVSVIMKDEKITYENHYAAVEKIANISGFTGGAYLQILEIIDSIIDKDDVTDETIPAVLRDSTALFERISEMAGSSTVLVFTFLMTVLQRPETSYRSFASIVKDLEGVHNVKGFAVASVVKIILSVLRKADISGASREDAVEGIIKPLSEFSRLAGPDSQGALEIARAMISKKETRYNDIEEILKELEVPVRDIRLAAGSEAQETCVVVSNILWRSKVNRENYLDILKATGEIVLISGINAPEAISAVRDVVASNEIADADIVTTLHGVSRLFKELQEAINDVMRQGRTLLFADSITYRRVYDRVKKGEKMETVIAETIQLLRASGFTEIMKDVPGLERIQFQDGGNAFNVSNSLARKLLASLPAIKEGRPETVPPASGSRRAAEYCGLEELRQKANETGIKLEGEIKFVKVLGRTLVFKDEKGDRLGIKLRKKGEPVSVLEDEARMLEWGGEEEQVRLLGYKPAEPVKIGDGYCFRFGIDSLEEPLQERITRELEAAMLEAKKKDASFDIHSDHAAIAYKIPKGSGFDGYVQENTDIIDFQQAILSSASELGALARRGVVHTALIDIFHNLADEGRRYIWSIDMNDPMARQGAGRVTAWRLACKWPNVGKNGEIRDWAELKHIDEIEKDPAKFLGDNGTFLAEQFGDKASNFLTLHFLGEYAVALTHLYGDWLMENGKIPDWEDEDAVTAMGNFMEDIYFEIIGSYLEMEEADIDALRDKYSFLVDWKMMGKQAAFYMKMKYMKFFDPEEADQTLEAGFPENIYGKDVTVTFGRIRPGTFDMEIGSKGDESETESVREAPALGIVNGAYPIQELITANYYLFAMAIAERIKGREKKEIVKGARMYKAAENMVPEAVDMMRKVPTYAIEPAASLDTVSPVISYLRRTERSGRKKGHHLHARSYLADDNWKDNVMKELDAVLPDFYDDVTGYEGKDHYQNKTRMVIRLVSKDGRGCAEGRSAVKEHIRVKLFELIDADRDEMTIGEKQKMAELIISSKIRFVDAYVGNAEYLNTVIDLFTDITMLECERYGRNENGDFKNDGYREELPVQLEKRFLDLLRLSITNYDALMEKVKEDTGSVDTAQLLKTIFSGYLLEIRPVRWELIREWKDAQDKVLRAL